MLENQRTLKAQAAPSSGDLTLGRLIESSVLWAWLYGNMARIGYPCSHSLGPRRLLLGNSYDGAGFCAITAELKDAVEAFKSCERQALRGKSFGQPLLYRWNCRWHPWLVKRRLYSTGTLVDKFVTHVISESSFEEMDRIYLTTVSWHEWAKVFWSWD